jgi:hypothetical protein
LARAITDSDAKRRRHEMDESRATHERTIETSDRLIASDDMRSALAERLDGIQLWRLLTAATATRHTKRETPYGPR